MSEQQPILDIAELLRDARRSGEAMGRLKATISRMKLRITQLLADLAAEKAKGDHPDD